MAGKQVIKSSNICKCFDNYGRPEYKVAKFMTTGKYANQWIETCPKPYNEQCKGQFTPLQGPPGQFPQAAPQQQMYQQPPQQYQAPPQMSPPQFQFPPQQQPQYQQQPQPYQQPPPLEEQYEMEEPRRTNKRPRQESDEQAEEMANLKYLSLLLLQQRIEGVEQLHLQQNEELVQLRADVSLMKNSIQNIEKHLAEKPKAAVQEPKSSKS